MSGTCALGHKRHVIFGLGHTDIMSGTRRVIIAVGHTDSMSGMCAPLICGSDRLPPKLSLVTLSASIHSQHACVRGADHRAGRHQDRTHSRAENDTPLG